MDSTLCKIRDKVYAQERLSFKDGLTLYASNDLHALGELANHVRERLNGNRAYYNVNVHLNPTNVCLYRCTFCAFRADLRSEKAYVMTDEQILERAAEAEARGATEMHIVGGLHHLLPYEWYLRVVRIIHEQHPRLHLKAYTPVEWHWFEELTGRSTKDILAEFREHGLGSLPGGGAEIFHPEVRDIICEHKADADVWFRIHREAHALGLRSNATMLYVPAAPGSIADGTYGLGLLDTTDGYSPGAVGHQGEGLGYMSWAACLPDEGAVVVVLTNRPALRLTVELVGGALRSFVDALRDG